MGEQLSSTERELLMQLVITSEGVEIIIKVEYKRPRSSLFDD